MPIRKSSSSVASPWLARLRTGPPASAASWSRFQEGTRLAWWRTMNPM